MLEHQENNEFNPELLSLFPDRKIPSWLNEYMEQINEAALRNIWKKSFSSWNEILDLEKEMFNWLNTPEKIKFHDARNEVVWLILWKEFVWKKEIESRLFKVKSGDFEELSTIKKEIKIALN